MKPFGALTTVSNSFEERIKGSGAYIGRYMLTPLFLGTLYSPGTLA
jgi:hypothetical protein